MSAALIYLLTRNLLIHCDTWPMPEFNLQPSGDDTVAQPHQEALRASILMWQCAVGGVCISIYENQALVLSLPHPAIASPPLPQRFIRKPSICVHMYILLPEQSESGWERDRVRASQECCFLWIIESLSLLMVYIIQVPSRHAFRNSFAWGNGEQRPGF